MIKQKFIHNCHTFPCEEHKYKTVSNNLIDFPIEMWTGALINEGG